MGFNTELLHGTKTGDPVTGATLTPVYQSSAFFQPSAEQHEKLFHNKAAGYSYTRINNPTIAAFEERMTVLEKDENGKQVPCDGDPLPVHPAWRQLPMPF